MECGRVRCAACHHADHKAHHRGYDPCTPSPSLRLPPQERLAEEQQRRREQFLQLPLPEGAVHFVDSVAGLEAMGRRLGAMLQGPPHRGSAHHASPPASPTAAAAAAPSPPGSPPVSPSAAAAAEVAVAAAASHDWEAEALPALGLDLEWQPDADNSSPPSLLQLSTGAGGRAEQGGPPQLAGASHAALASRCASPHLPLTLTISVLCCADAEVFVVDLLTLAPHEAQLTAALQPVLASERVVKLGTCGGALAALWGCAWLQGIGGCRAWGWLLQAANRLPMFHARVSPCAARGCRLRHRLGLQEAGRPPPRGLQPRAQLPGPQRAVAQPQH